MHIPVEALSADDHQQLESVQKDLIKFGLHSPVELLAKHIYNSSIFSQMMRLYPILGPAGVYGIYQTWR